jgi:putative transposase
MGDTEWGLCFAERMPWKEVSPVDLRKQLVKQYLSGAYSLAELCRRFGVSRKTSYKWIGRYRDSGEQQTSLEDQSRRPRSSPTATEPWLEQAIVSARKQRPSWGPKKLRAVMAKASPSIALPSVSSFAAIFKRHGLVRPRRRHSRLTPYTAPFASVGGPNALWCIDFKGQFAVGRTVCYPLTVTDAYSRYLIACIGLRSTQGDPVRRALERIFDEFGLPDAIRSDNGPPFASRGVAGLSQLSVWWHKLGIRHERIQPGKPQQNGRHERMHLTLKQETASPAAPSMPQQQTRFDKFRACYNDERPHEAIGQRTPANLYEPSHRRLPEPPWGKDHEYPDDYETVRLSRLGMAPWRHGAFFVSTALKHVLLGLNWQGGQRWRVFFGPLPIGGLTTLPRRRRATFAPVREVSPMSSEWIVTHVLGPTYIIDRGMDRVDPGHFGPRTSRTGRLNYPRTFLTVRKCPGGRAMQ